MKCDICDQEFANSEEVKAHKERVHPIAEREDGDLEKPDINDSPEPQPVIRAIGPWFLQAPVQFRLLSGGL